MGAKNKNEPSRRLLNFQTAFKRGAIHNRKKYLGIRSGSWNGSTACAKWALRACKGDYPIGWSEKPKSWKSKNGQADYLPRHSLDVRTVFEI